MVEYREAAPPLAPGGMDGSPCPEPRPLFRLVPPRPARDLRLDVLRGWLQLTIFMAHAALFAEGSSWLGGWIVHTAWGYSDSSEQFIFTSGLGLGSVFALKHARDGAGAAMADLLRRTAVLWRTHLVLFAVFGALVVGGGALLGMSGDAERMGWAPLLERPVSVAALIPPLLYQPRYMEILPVFLVCMVMLGPFMALLERIGDAALVVPFGLYAATHGLGLTVPALGAEGWGGWGFNPLAWQALYLLGAWIGRRSLLTGGRAVPRHPLLIAAALLVLVWGFFVRIATYGWWPEAWLPFGWLPPLGWLILKEDLGPILLAHGLALAYLCAILIPRDLVLFHRFPFTWLAGAGRHSLQVFCVGLCLSWAVSVVLRSLGRPLWLDAACLLAGCLTLLATARWLDHRREAARA